MNQLIKKEIRNLYLSFDKANSYEIEYIKALFEYLIDVYEDDEEIFDMNKKLDEELIYSKKERLFFLISREEDIKKYIDDNIGFIYENIITPNEFKKIPSTSVLPLREDNFSYILKAFFLSLNEDIFNFYEQYNSEERILYGLTNETTFTSLDNSNTIIFIKELSDLIDMMVLVHELAHAYYFKLNNINIKNRGKIDIEIKEEIPAKILEIKFIEFLRISGLYEQSNVLENAFDYVYFEYSKSKYEYESLKYIIASDIAKTMGKDVDINEFFKHVYETNIQSLLLENSEKKEKGKRFFK